MSTFETRLLLAAAAGLLVSVLILSVRLAGGRQLGAREAYVGGATAALLTMLGHLLLAES